MKQVAIVGCRGAVGQAFTHYARAGGLEVLGLEQEDGDKLRRLCATDAPVLVCTRAEHLRPLLGDEGLNQLDPARLVFVQNGMIEGALRQCRVDPEAVGRGVLYISITEGKVSVAAETPFYGGRTPELVPYLKAGGLLCRFEPDRDKFLFALAVKFVWNCAFGLIGGVYGGTVDEAIDQHAVVLCQVSDECCRVLEAELAVRLDATALYGEIVRLGRLVGQHRSVGREMENRNLWVYHQALARGIPVPANAQLLAQGGWLQPGEGMA